jgi:hypothetical protein
MILHHWKYILLFLCLLVPLSAATFLADTCRHEIVQCALPDDLLVPINMSTSSYGDAAEIFANVSRTGCTAHILCVQLKDQRINITCVSPLLKNYMFDPNHLPITSNLTPEEISFAAVGAVFAFSILTGIAYHCCKKRSRDFSYEEI